MLKIYEAEFYWILSSDKNNAICLMCDKLDSGISTSAPVNFKNKNQTTNTTIIKNLIPVILNYDPDAPTFFIRICDLIRNG